MSVSTPLSPFLPCVKIPAVQPVREEWIMTITVEAVYENGQLKLKDAIALGEGTPVRVAITPLEDYQDPLAGLIGVCKTGRDDGAANHDKYLYGKRP
jgi:predicted DNA-binding antitoxin AbrB/MazE fold protein